MTKNLLSALFFLICFGFTAQNAWFKCASTPGSKRERAVGFAIGSKGYIGLGQDTNNFMINDFWSYDPFLDTWTQKATFPGGARRDAVGFCIGSKGYVGTGIDSSIAPVATLYNDFWEYDTLANSWTQKAPYPYPIYSSSGFGIGTKGYICCGKWGPANYSSELWRYDPVFDNWSQMANYPGGVRVAGVAFTIGNNGYYGTGTDQNAFTQDFYKFNTANGTWSPICTFPGTARFGCSSFSVNGKGYIVFGDDGGYKDELWEYDPSQDYWNVKAYNPGGARKSAVAFNIGNRAWAGAGKGFGGTKRDFREYGSLSIGINEADTKILSSIYPNPITENATVVLSANTFSEYKNLIWEICDVQGKIVKTEKINSANFLIDRNGISSGNYFLNIRTSGNLIASKKIILQ